MTNAEVPEPQIFYTERIPNQWNQMLAAQESLGEPGRSVLEGMTAVNATIRVDILDSDESYFLNITHGRMQAGEDASHPPFMTLRQSLGAYHRIASEAGDSAMALLGGLSGLAGEMKLTQQRIDNLADVKGLMKFVVLGERGFELLTHFGTDPIPDEPATSITVDEEAYRDLRSGDLNPQDAFMNGRIAIEGDMQLAMQLALAAISPD
jgi:putative sterol carrier protein